MKRAGRKRLACVCAMPPRGSSPTPRRTGHSWRSSKRLLCRSGANHGEGRQPSHLNLDLAPALIAALWEWGPSYYSDTKGMDGMLELVFGLTQVILYPAMEYGSDLAPNSPVDAHAGGIVDAMDLRNPR